MTTATRTSSARRRLPRTLPQTLRRTLAAAAAVAVVGLAGACGADSTSDEADGDDSAGSSVSSAEMPAEMPAEASDAEPAMEDGIARDAAAGDAPADAAMDEEQKLISNGSVQLKSKDVAEAIFDVRNVVDTYAGEIEANETETDDKGDPLRARLQVRVPTSQFDEAMQDLEKSAVLIASSGNTKDVTTEVLDRDIRVDVQRRSIERISLLLEQATSIRDVVAIEAQLSQRQADLAVLEKESRVLADQTAMATINVSVERIRDKEEPPPAEDDDSGFFAGLEAGWDGLRTFGTGLATVLGALLPWMVVVAVLAIPGVPLLRRYRRKQAEPSPATTPATAG